MARPKGPDPLRVAKRVTKEVNELACTLGLTNDEDALQFQSGWNARSKIIEAQFTEFAEALEIVFWKMHALTNDVAAPNLEFLVALNYGRTPILPDVEQWASSVAQIRRRVLLLMAARNWSIEDALDTMLMQLAGVWSRESKQKQLGTDATSPFIVFAHLALSHLDSPRAELADKIDADPLAYRWRRIKRLERTGESRNRIILRKQLAPPRRVIRPSRG